MYPAVTMFERNIQAMTTQAYLKEKKDITYSANTLSIRKQESNIPMNTCTIVEKKYLKI